MSATVLPVVVAWGKMPEPRWSADEYSIEWVTTNPFLALQVRIQEQQVPTNGREV